MKKKLRRVLTSISCVLLCAVFGSLAACGSTSSSPYIGDNGNWFVDGVDTGVSATGPQGEKGDKGDKGDSATGGTIDPGDGPVLTPWAESLIDVAGSQSGYNNGGKFYLDYATIEEEQVAAKEVAETIAEEGDVLLKNEGALPLTSKEKHVSVFGTGSYNLINGGAGSGAGSTGNNGIEYTGLIDSLETVGIKINPTLENMYASYKGTDNEVPVTNYNKTITSTYSSYNDAAIITFSRQGAEDGDLAARAATGHSDPTDHALMLQDNEADLVRHVKQYFDKVIVVINSSNIMQIPELAETKTESNLGVDAILWIGNPGNNGAAAVGRILTGEVNPSGKTVDLWEKDFTKGPTWTNFSKQDQNSDGIGNALDAIIYNSDGEDTGFRTVEYREGIYLGYRYYETLYADASDKEEAYSNVLYPFGYGLSYTTFDWELSSDIAESAKINAANETVTMRVKVTNTGDVAGKDVVQLYSNPPYTVGGIEKSAANLVGFAKTKLLEPGESETVTIQIAAQDLASYDWNDANDNGNTGYELESGTYYLTANRDSHTPVITIERTVDETILCKTDLTTGEEINNVFTGNYTSTRWSLEDGMISRANGLRQPTPASKDDRTYDDAEITMLLGQEDYEPYMDQTTDPWYVSEVPDNWTQATTHEEDYSDMEIKLRELASLRYNDPTVENGVATAATDAGSVKWDEFMNQLTWDELCTLVEKGGGTKEMPSLGLESTGYTDGPQQLRGGTFWPSSPIIAATYNVDLAAEQGRMVGNEAILLNQPGWAGPAANIHRSPLSGRNFEYYSEDGVLSAKIMESVVAAASAKGVICYVKHMFLNDQEQYRNAQGGVLTWATEQTIREIYAKPFEAVAKGGHTVGYMSSFNRIGYSNASTNYALHKLLVRGEWQFKGRSITDAWVKMYNPVDLMVRVGDEQPLGDGEQYPEYGITRGEWDVASNCVKVPGSAAEVESETNSLLSPTHYYAVRVAAQHILFSTVNSITCKNNLDIEQGSMYFGQYVSGTQMIDIPGLDDVKNITLKEGSVLPEGLSITEDGTSITGAATTVGDYTVTVQGTTNNWVDFEADIVIHVVGVLEVKSNGTFVENSANNIITVNAGEALDLEFYSDYFVYGQQYSLSGGIPEAIKVTDNPGFQGRGMGGKWQIINLYQEFENWDECKDTVAHPLYRGNVGAIPRNEDSTAGDMPTLDVNNAVEKYEYSFYKVGELPAGLSESWTYQQVNGLSFGSYDVQKAYHLTGSIADTGDYQVTVTFQVPMGSVLGGWVGKLWFGGVQLAQVTRTITIRVV